MSIILGIGNGFRNSLLLTFLRSVKNLTVPSFFGIINEGDDHGESTSFLITPNFVSLSSSLLNISLRLTGTGNGLQYVGSSPSFTCILTGAVLNSPNVPSNNTLYLFSNWSNAVRCYGLK